MLKKIVGFVKKDELQKELSNYKSILDMCSVVIKSKSFEKLCGLNSLQLNMFPNFLGDMDKSFLDIFKALVYSVKEGKCSEAKEIALALIPECQANIERIERYF